MLYTTQKGESFDLEKDFSAPEPHALQKLLLWKEPAASVEEFRHRKEKALGKGWGERAMPRRISFRPATLGPKGLPWNITPSGHFSSPPTS